VAGPAIAAPPTLLVLPAQASSTPQVVANPLLTPQSIKNPAVWESMAHLCIKNKRLDVAGAA